ncbi:RNA-directed DNA polymerase, eukaryota, reverse transcriptase zinc-binding domain protein, partial [Tanacetum coccineum]
MDVFSRLFALDSQQDCKVSDRWCQVDGVWGGNWSWRLPPRGRAISDLLNLTSLIGHLSLSVGSTDKWSWTSDSSVLFKVKTLSNIIQSHLFSDCDLGNHHLWNSWISRKVNVCVWRSSLNRLAARTNLCHRGVSLISELCPFCDSTPEKKTSSRSFSVYQNFGFQLAALPILQIGAAGFRAPFLCFFAS